MENDISIDTIIWTLTICTVLLFFGKSATPFINDAINRYFFGIKERKNKHEAFDQMVEYKKSQMRGSTNNEVNPLIHRKKSKNAFQVRVEQKFDQLSKSNHKKELEEVKRIISLFDNLNWGAGDEIKNIAKSISTHIKHNINESQCSKILNLALRDDHLQKIPQNEPLSLETMAKYLSSTANLLLILESKPYQKKIFSLVPTSNLLHKSFSMIIFSERNDINKSLDKVLSPAFTKLSEAQFKSLYTKYKREQLNELLKTHLNILNLLTPIHVDQEIPELERALKILNLRAKPDKNALKKIYKKIAMEKHPDTASGHGLQENYTKQINENFTHIQWAYDILLND